MYVGYLARRALDDARGRAAGGALDLGGDYSADTAIRGAEAGRRSETAAADPTTLLLQYKRTRPGGET